jgi:hypothetical protein
MLLQLVPHQIGRRVIMLHLGDMFLKHNQLMANRIKIEVGEEANNKGMVEDINKDTHSKGTHNKDTLNKDTLNKEGIINNNSSLCMYNKNIVVVEDRVV